MLLFEPFNFYRLAIIIFFAVTCFIAVGCTVQWAIRNKRTTCGFTNDNIEPYGRKDPATFYGNP
ncbi:hypothetical protein EBR77_00700 [bacterium]|nr:hypothetical protein [bacterium]